MFHHLFVNHIIDVYSNSSWICILFESFCENKAYFQNFVIKLFHLGFVKIVLRHMDPTYLSILSFIHLSECLSFPSLSLSLYLSIYLLIYIYIYLFIYLQLHVCISRILTALSLVFYLPISVPIPFYGIRLPFNRSMYIYMCVGVVYLKLSLDIWFI